MCHRVNRLLNVLLLAPVFALMAGSVAPLSAHAQTGDQAPPPYVVCIDPGHGGAVNNSDPQQQFDPGAIGLGGIQEKNLTLDVSARLRTLLEADGASVAMTRTTDQFVTIEGREATCEQAGANIFVSLHFNYFTDTSVEGSLVLYPTEASHAFATAMTKTLTHDLAAQHIASAPEQLRDNWWTHATMPTITIESAYITNSQDAALLGTATFKQELAVALRHGIETYDPLLLQRKQQLATWHATHPVSVAALTSAVGDLAVATGQSGWTWTGVLRVLAGLALVGLAVRFPMITLRLVRLVLRVVWALLQAGFAGGAALLAGASRQQHQRRRRRAVQQRALVHRRARSARPNSVYDELWL